MAKVIVQFPYSENGYTIEHLSVGDERDFGAQTQSLLTAGWIEVEESQETTTETAKTKKKK